jgi:hypothetical protein
VNRRLNAEEASRLTALAGIYAVHCLPTGQRWIGRTPDLCTIQNRLWFTLRQGNNPHRALHAAWNEHGADSFTFEDVERLKEDDDAISTETARYVRDQVLKERLSHWCATFSADAI